MRALEGEGAVVAGRLQRPGRRGDLAQRRGDERPSTRIAATVPAAAGYRRARCVDERGARRGPPGGRAGAAAAADRAAGRPRAVALAGGRPAVAAAPGETRGARAAAGGGRSTADERQRRRALHAARARRRAGRRGALAGRERPDGRRPGLRRRALLLAAARHLAAAGEAPSRGRSSGCGAPTSIRWPSPRPRPRSRCGRAPRRRPGTLVVADALLDRPGAGRALDVVVGNPPFLSQLAAATARSADDADRAARRGSARPCAPYTDTAALFLLAALRPGRARAGRSRCVQPQSVLARARRGRRARTPSAQLGPARRRLGPDRRRLRRRASTCACPSSRSGAAASGRATGARTWRDADGVPGGRPAAPAHARRRGHHHRRLPQQYYGMVDHVARAGDCPTGTPLVTTGLVDLGRCAWGERRPRVGRPDVGPPGRRRRAPLDGRAADWAAAHRRARSVVVATQTRVVEVAVDDDGRWIAGVPLVVVLAPAERLWPPGRRAGRAGGDARGLLRARGGHRAVAAARSR